MDNERTMIDDDDTPIDLSGLLGGTGHQHAPGPSGPGGPSGDEWAEALARTVAHLAAQLTVAQLRLRALASAVAARGVVDPAEVDVYLAALARVDGGLYLRENLGDALAAVIDVDALEHDLLVYLTSPGGVEG